jgi:hypothetical protein
MRKLWIVLAVFVTASMTSTAYGAEANGVSVVVAPVTKVTVAPVAKVTNQVAVGSQVGSQAATAISTQVQTPVSIALHGNASATANAVAATTAITKSTTTIKFGPSSAIGQ